MQMYDCLIDLDQTKQVMKHVTEYNGIMVRSIQEP